VIHSVSQLLS